VRHLLGDQPVLVRPPAHASRRPCADPHHVWAVVCPLRVSPTLVDARSPLHSGAIVAIKNKEVAPPRHEFTRRATGARGPDSSAPPRCRQSVGRQCVHVGPCSRQKSHVQSWPRAGGPMFFIATARVHLLATVRPVWSIFCRWLTPVASPDLGPFRCRSWHLYGSDSVYANRFCAVVVALIPDESTEVPSGLYIHTALY